jgi:YD repeat-containing protein
VEVDYQSPAPGGVSVIRYYNSSGYFDNVYRGMTNGDVWRTNWSSRIHMYVNQSSGALDNPYVSGALVRPDGTVRYFNRGNGREVQNIDGGTWKVVIDFELGLPIRWTVTTDQNDVEVYAGGGYGSPARLQSVTTRDGQVYTLDYDVGGLKSVTDPMGRVTMINGRGFTTPNGETFAYTYDFYGRFESVTYPDGGVKKYHYEDSRFRYALTGITDERDVRLAIYAYDSNALAVSTQHIGGVD